MNRFSELSKMLDEQLAIHQKLLEIENQKTTVLVKGTVEELDNLVNTEQPYLMNSSNLERQREAWQNTMGMSGLTLRQMMETYPDAAFLASNYEIMTGVLSELKRISALNHRILNTKLDVLNLVLSEAGLVQSKPVTYSNTK